MARTKQVARRPLKFSLFINFGSDRSMWIYTFEAFHSIPFSGFEHVELERFPDEPQFIGKLENLQLLQEDPSFVTYFKESGKITSKFYSEMLYVLFAPLEVEDYNHCNVSISLTDEDDTLKRSIIEFLDPFTARNLALTCKKYYQLIFETKSDGRMLFRIPTLELRVRPYEEKDETFNYGSEESEEESEEESDESEESEEEDLKPSKKTKLNH